jgi:hypothetical protein
MTIELLMFVRQRSGDGLFGLFYFGGLLALIVAWTQWDRRYRRRWLEYRSRNWTRVKGQFDEGEIITMRKGRSQEIAGYEVWLAYEYWLDGEQVGVFQLSERPKDEAEAARKLLANREITIRVNPRNPERSFVSDDDINTVGLVEGPN